MQSIQGFSEHVGGFTPEGRRAPNQQFLDRLYATARNKINSSEDGIVAVKCVNGGKVYRSWIAEHAVHSTQCTAYFSGIFYLTLTDRKLLNADVLKRETYGN